MGDFNGIGPEVALKHISGIDLSESTPLFIGSETVFDFYATRLELDLTPCRISDSTGLNEGCVNLVSVCDIKPDDIQPGMITEQGGLAAMKAVEHAIEYCLNDTCGAMVTAPISKEAIHKAGFRYPGHTEFLAEKTDTGHYMMILAAGELRVGLLTGHIPLRDVAASMDTDRIVHKLKILNSSLSKDFGITNPAIAVFGLNPHAGDGGILGTEEQVIIEPALQRARELGIRADGPFPADGFFGSRRQLQYDGILAIYHDQGLIPFKTLSFGKGINYTAGLPIIRTSPDHGTAYDIAGQNLADPASFAAAYQLALQMVNIRYGEKYAEE